MHRNSHMSYSTDIKSTLDLFIDISEKGALEAVYTALQYNRFTNYKQIVDFAQAERLRHLTYYFEENYMIDYYSMDWKNTTDLNSLKISEAMRDILEESFS